MPRDPASSLVTTGQLDWVALGRASAALPLEVMARIAGAGVEGVTVNVANAICSTFSFCAEGQKQFTDSLSGLRGTGAFVQTLWFGFGIKSAASVMAETEQGAWCVALSAALCTIYTPFRAAEIWRELSKQADAPVALRPSIHQWCNLVKACSGSLARSHFQKIFDHFAHLLVPSRFPPREPASAESVSEALLVIAQLTKDTTASAAFIGGMDCALLAAIALSLLHLRVKILNEHQVVMFESHFDAPQAVFIQEPSAGSRHRSKIVSTRAFYVSSGAEIIDSSKEVYLGPTSWKTVLRDAFPPWRAFSDYALSKAFTVMLRDAAVELTSFPTSESKTQKATSARGRDVSREKITRYDAYYDDEVTRRRRGDSEDYPGVEKCTSMLDTVFTNHSRPYPMRTAIEFIYQSRSLFPEIAAIISDPHTVLKTSGTLSSSSKQIKSICGCKHCSPRKGVPPTNHPDCLWSVAVAVIRILCRLSAVKIQGELCLNLYALRSFCTNESTDERGDSDRPDRALEEVLFLFTGTKVDLPPLSTSAACARGVCAFYSILKDLDQDPEDALMIEVLPGNIRHSNHHYQRVRDLTSPQEDPVLPRVPMASLRMIVEESDDPNSLGAYYRLKFADGRVSDMAICRAVQESQRRLLIEKVPIGTEYNPPMVFNMLKSTPWGGYSNSHRHHWSFVHIVGYEKEESVLRAEILVLEAPALYLVHQEPRKSDDDPLEPEYQNSANSLRVIVVRSRSPSLPRTPSGNAVVNMCCCQSCVHRLTRDDMRRLFGSKVAHTGRWSVTIVFLRDGIAETSEYIFDHSDAGGRRPPERRTSRGSVSYVSNSSYRASPMQPPSVYPPYR